MFAHHNIYDSYVYTGICRADFGVKKLNILQKHLLFPSISDAPRGAAGSAPNIITDRTITTDMSLESTLECDLGVFSSTQDEAVRSLGE